MSLPPLRHPSWMIVLTIALFGGSLTALLGGSGALAKVLIALAAFAAMLAGRAVRRQPPFG